MSPNCSIVAVNVSTGGPIFQRRYLRIPAFPSYIGFWLWICSDRGRVALAVAQELGVNRHTAERMHRLLQHELWINRPGEKLSGISESDEVYIICGAKGIKQKV